MNTQLANLIGSRLSTTHPSTVAQQRPAPLAQRPPTFAEAIRDSLLDRLSLQRETFFSFSTLLDRYASDQATLANGCNAVARLITCAVSGLVEVKSSEAIARTEAKKLVDEIANIPAFEFPNPIGLNVCQHALSVYGGNNDKAVVGLKKALWSQLQGLTDQVASYAIEAHRNLLRSEAAGLVRWHNAHMCTASLRRMELTTRKTKTRSKRTTAVQCAPVVEQIELLDAHVVRVDAFPEDRLSPHAAELISLIPDWLKPSYGIIDGSRISHRLIRNDKEIETLAVKTEILPSQPRVRIDPILVFGRTLALTIWE